VLPSKLRIRHCGVTKVAVPTSGSVLIAHGEPLAPTFSSLILPLLFFVLHSLILLALFRISLLLIFFFRSSTLFYISS
jgi:hypothetical protein